MLMPHYLNEEFHIPVLYREVWRDCIHTHRMGDNPTPQEVSPVYAVMLYKHMTMTHLNDAVHESLELFAQHHKEIPEGFKPFFQLFKK
jgi:hypothetical protein